MKPLVVIESPYSGDVEGNLQYVRRCIRDSLSRGEAPIASHALHTQFLDDTDPAQRALGIEAGLAWYRVADKCVVYKDRGVSSGMIGGIQRAFECGVHIESRWIEREVVG